MLALLGMGREATLLTATALAIVGLIILVARFKLNAFLALIVAALFVGICSSMPPLRVAKAFQEGMGKTLGGIAGVLGLGTMLGGLLAASGGAEVLSRSLVRTLGPSRVHWCLMVLALAVGFTTWFAVGLVMLVPILLTLTKETKMPFLKLALPLLAVLSIMHGVMPPHPGPLVAIEALHANAEIPFEACIKTNTCTTIEIRFIRKCP
jgi:GntP family gluconate:H+ symporter